MMIILAIWAIKAIGTKKEANSVSTE